MQDSRFTVVFIVSGLSEAHFLLFKQVFCKSARKRSGQIRNFDFRKFGIEKYENDLRSAEGPPILEKR